MILVIYLLVRLDLLLDNVGISGYCETYVSQDVTLTYHIYALEMCNLYALYYIYVCIVHRWDEIKINYFWGRGEERGGGETTEGGGIESERDLEREKEGILISTSVCLSPGRAVILITYTRITEEVELR